MKNTWAVGLVVGRVTGHSCSAHTSPTTLYLQRGAKKISYILQAILTGQNIQNTAEPREQVRSLEIQSCFRAALKCAELQQLLQSHSISKEHPSACCSLSTGTCSALHSSPFLFLILSPLLFAVLEIVQGTGRSHYRGRGCPRALMCWSSDQNFGIGCGSLATKSSLSS